MRFGMRGDRHEGGERWEGSSGRRVVEFDQSLELPRRVSVTRRSGGLEAVSGRRELTSKERKRRGSRDPQTERIGYVVVGKHWRTKEKPSKRGNK